MNIALPRPARSQRLTILALAAIDEAGLQAPSIDELQFIVQHGIQVMSKLEEAMLEMATTQQLLEFYEDFVVRCINRAPGIGDACKN